MKFLKHLNYSESLELKKVYCYPKQDWGLFEVMMVFYVLGFPGKEFTCNAVDMGSILGSGRSSREGNGNPLQYSCHKNHMNRGVWRATIRGSQNTGLMLWSMLEHAHIISHNGYPSLHICQNSLKCILTMRRFLFYKLYPSKIDKKESHLHSG